MKQGWEERWPGAEELLRHRRVILSKEVGDLAVVLVHDGIGEVMFMCFRHEGKWFFTSEAAAGDIWYASDNVPGRGVGTAEIAADDGVEAVRISSPERTYEVWLNADGLGLILEPDIPSELWHLRLDEERIDGEWRPADLPPA
jgi:hypothetical protein